jgi:1-acyl-sn-glycerol-3-phosphate acyltransferase
MIRQLSKLFLIIVCFGVSLIITGILCPLANRIYNTKQAGFKKNQMKSFWMKLVGLSLNLKIETTGEPITGAALVVSNHISWIDIVVIGGLVPGCFIAKSDLLRWPIIGFLTKQSGNIFVKRGNKQQVHETTEQMAWILKQDLKIIAFPEGTTSDGKRVLPFHGSLFHPAILTKMPIQTLVIEYLDEAQELAPYIDDDVFIPHLWQILGLSTINVRLNFNKSIDSRDKTRQSVKQESWQQINRKLVTQRASTAPISTDS